MSYTINIIGRLESTTGIGHVTTSFANVLQKIKPTNILTTRTNHLHANDLNTGNCKITALEHAKISPQSICIYTDVLSNGPHDTNAQKTNPESLNFAYTMFDSTRIPREWIDILHKHFDAAIVPSEHLIPIYERSGFSKPIFCLPLILNLDSLLQEPVNQQKNQCVFGIVGLVERRKNFLLTLEAFHKAFGDNPYYQLHMHFSGIIDHEYYNEILNNPLSHKTNVQITQSQMDRKSYLELLKSFDFVVLLSAGEGYSIVPREALALGKPVILSDASAHASICKSGEVLSITSNIPIPAYYPAIHRQNKYIGIQQTAYIEDVIQCFQHAAENKKLLYTNEMISKRRKVAETFTEQHLLAQYQAIFAPKQINLSDKNALFTDRISTNSKQFYQKFNALLKNNTSSSITDNSQNKTIVSIRDAGFFSLLNVFVSYLVWELEKDPKAIVLPDWRVQSLFEANIFNPLSFCYGTLKDGNIWLKLFKPLPYSNIEESDYQNSGQLYEGAFIANDCNEQREPLLTYIHAYNLYKSKEFSNWRKKYNNYVSRYIQLQPHIQFKINTFKDQHFSNKIVIAAHIKHPSHSIEQIDGKMPPISLYYEKISEIIHNEKLKKDNFIIFIATELESVIEYFKEKFPENLVYYTEAKRTSKEQDSKYATSRIKDIVGFQIQHITAKDKQSWNLKMAEDVIIDAWLLASSHYFIHVTSNIATAVAYLNPKTKMVYCE